MDELTVSFQGGLADEHRLPAYAASQSLYGISRSLLVVTNYLGEGKVRHRKFDESGAHGFEINLVASQPGSFQFLFEILADPAMQTIGHTVAGKVAGDLTLAFIKSVFKRCIGEKAEPEIENLESNGELNSGDIGALVEAIEPAMKAAHTAINHGSTNIILISGTNNIVNLDSSSKTYVHSSKRTERPEAKVFSIASYNANSRSGRAYDYERGMTVPFDLSPQIDRTSMRAIMKSMSDYALRLPGDENNSSQIALRYNTTIAPDGRVKKIHIEKARAEILSLK
ncbi:hypothetical protein [Bradyrhizobium symbiodeficiens]|uniref:DUF7946 domain-containing protein n=1 Tax=Bradyrhizobium symbiodeficiens TaxID=1404367 RepID=UPI00140F7253|nr:hypothetical protein [Bradyrhizobium symbiodeficiens]QIP03120.1 hypothetical protein HAU86_26530 [Bradyrhizobium symbiodeficiens]